MGDGGEFALSDLVPSVSVGGERLRPRDADDGQSQSKDVRLRQATVVLQKREKESFYLSVNLYLFKRGGGALSKMTNLL